MHIKVTPSLESMENQMKRINGALTELEKLRGEISNQCQAIDANIHNTIGRLN